jgi:alpha-tubulin suppressor-like RCC1 family protein/subtilisin family serine protease
MVKKYGTILVEIYYHPKRCEGMKKRLKKSKFSIVLILIMLLLGNSLPVTSQMVETNPVEVAKTELPILENKESIKVEETTPIPEEAKKLETKDESNPEKKPVTYGPYNKEETGANGHAYEPFLVETEKEESVSEDLGYRKDSLLVKYKDSVSKAKDGAYSVKGKTLSLSKQGIQSLEPLVPEKKASSANAKSKKIESKLAKWNKATLAKGKDIEKIIKELKKDASVESVEYDYIRAIDVTASTVGMDDENISQQWHLETAGVQQAWDYLDSLGMNPGGSRDVVVAVIDTGVDYNHPDLKGNMWVNTGEIANNGADDDRNGFVDDVYGASMVGNEWGGESGDPADDNGHGTHVAGIIAAQGNNGIGGVGVAYNTRIMAIKAAQSGGQLTSSDIAQAVYYAVDKGADVINMSFGGYGRSTVEEDALQVAFGHSVLVASAGNDGNPNLPHQFGKDMYPAAYNWVLGVMAEKPAPSANGDYLADFSNWDYKPQDSHEYEVMAPGVDIYSTLPNGQYAKWSGTSMSAPVVAGIAALVRSKFTDKESYSSRFIMGQIAETGQWKQGITYDMKKPPLEYKSVNALGALTNTPKPKLSYLEHYIFDKKEIAAENDGDGVVDAGETVDIAMVIRNHWGKADNVKVTIDTKSGAGIADPYVTILQDTVDYGAVGTFAIDDNGLIYENDMITGVNLPFKLKIAPNTPNDHIVPINVTITASNGYDAQDTTTYKFESGYSFMVRNGVELPGVIDKDMTLTKDKYWIVPNATLIKEGATVTVEPGTQIQFWSTEAEDPYAEKTMAYIEVRGKFLVNGTAEEPVEMFPSGMYPGYEVKVYSTSSIWLDGQVGGYRGYADISYANIMNPHMAVQKVDHSYFTQDNFDLINKRYLDNGVVKTDINYGPVVHTESISNSKFYNIGANPYNSTTDYPSFMLNVRGKSEGNLFDSSYYYMNSIIAKDNVLLKNYKLKDTQHGERNYWVSNARGFGTSIDAEKAFQSAFPIKNNENGSTYITLKSNLFNLSPVDEMQKVTDFATSLGGHIVTINDAEENDFIQSYINTYINRTMIKEKYPTYDVEYFSRDPYIGLNDHQRENTFKWANGEDLTYTNWGTSEPDNIVNDAYQTPSPANFVKMDRNTGKWYDYNNSYNDAYILEIPGVSNVTGVSLDKTEITLGAGGGTAQLNASVTPAKATNKTVSWSSSNPGIATVDQNGFVTPLTVGKTTITVTTEDGAFTATTEVNVIEIVPATGISVNKQSIELTKGQQETLSASVLPANSTDKRVKWSTSNPAIARVDGNGKVTGISNGNAIITVTSEDGGFTASTTVSVIVPVEGVKLDNEFLRVVLGDEPVTLKATVQPEGATNKSVKWASSNKAVVEVDDNGTLTPVAKGTAMITATTVNGGYTASSVITVWEEKVSFNTTSISAGTNYTVAVNEDGTVWSWGNNENGQLGDGTHNNRLTPVKVEIPTEIVKVVAGTSRSYALDKLGDVWEITSYPTKISTLSNVKDISAGNDYAIVLKNDGTVWSWGNNYNGQLGDGTTSYRYEPIQVPNLSNVVSIDAGTNHTVALVGDGTVWAWGANYYGQVGDGSSDNNRLNPVKVKNLSNIKAISAGDIHTIALKENGTVWAWGYGGYGQTGNNWSKKVTPEQVQGVTNVEKISAGGYNTAVIKSDGTVWVFGKNEKGQLGNDSIAESYTPLQIEGILAQDISVGFYHSVITKIDGTVWSWGYNLYGQLGNLTTENSSKPVQTLFGILPDNESPSLVESTPINNDFSVKLDSSITLTFNEGIKPGDNYPLITLRDQNNQTISLKSKRIDNNVLILEPMGGFKENTNYTLTIPANSLKDVFNNSYEQDIYLSFSTSTDYVVSVVTAKQPAAVPYFEVMPLLKNFKVSNYIEATNNTLVASDTTATNNTTKEEVKVSATTAPTKQSTTAPIQTQPITESFIQEKRQAFINSGVLSTITNNAILNRWWDPNVENWMRFTSETGETNKRYLSNNYWGTTNKDLIEKALIHFNDFRNMEEIIVNPILTTAPETAYPFVTDVYVSTETQERATKVGAETIEVHVKFNRDMDQTKQPQVSFGPDMPTTDYTVNGVNGGWMTPRHWVGSMKISPLTGDGYQFFRVANAVAADDPWLVTGNDTERFRFEIVTSGTEAMNLQATGSEGKVQLSWTQDDFETLAGYNIYRSEDRVVGFTKINPSLVPADQKSFEDKEVTPGKMYYYKFTVVKTDLTESNPSNVASAAPIDTIAPVINHIPVQQVNVGQPVQIFADVTDNVKVSKVTLFYKAAGDTTYKQQNMVATTNNRYSTTIEGSSVVAPWMDYYIEATDGASKAQYGNINKPNRMMVSDKPTITSVTPAEGKESGATKVVIHGSNFKQGATVLFGEAVASNVVVDSATQLTAETPAHYPAKVDVKVNNPDGTNGVILGGYTYVSEGIEVSIPNVTGNRGDIIEVPVDISNVSGLRSADFKVKFDSNLLGIQDVAVGNLTKNFSIASNTNTSGEVQLSMASSTAVNGSGAIAMLSFKVLDSELTSSPITLEQLSFNAGSIKTNTINGTFSFEQTYKMSGNVRYYSNYKSVPNVLFELLGSQQQYQNYSDVSGYFALSGIRKGSYGLKASKADDINGISSYDASLILQSAVGLITLTNQQKVAADVDANGVVNALDAAYVLEKSVDLISLPFPGAGKVWAFEGERQYDNLSSDISYQDLTAILIGDVNGDWGVEETNMSSLYTVGKASVASDGKLTAPVEFNVGDADLYSAKVSVTYDPSQVKPSEVVKSASTKDYSIVYNTVEEGVLEVAIAGSKPLQGTGKLVDLKFEPVTASVKTTDLQVTNGNMNDENIVVKTLKTNKASNQTGSTKVRWTSDALGDDLNYSWVLYKGSIGVEKQNYSKRNYLETTLKTAGTYKVLLMVKDKNGNVVSKFSEEFTVN